MIFNFVGIRAANSNQRWLLPLFMHYPDTGSRASHIAKSIAAPNWFADLVGIGLDGHGMEIRSGTDNLLMEVVLPNMPDEAELDAIAHRIAEARGIAPGVFHHAIGAASPCTLAEYQEVLPGKPWRKHVVKTLKNYVPKGRRQRQVLELATACMRQNSSLAEQLHTLSLPPEFFLCEIIEPQLSFLTTDDLEALEAATSRRIMLLNLSCATLSKEDSVVAVAERMSKASLPVVRMLLERYGMTPGQRWIMENAVDSKRLDVVKYLLNDERVKPSSSNFEAKAAARQGEFEIWQALFDAGFCAGQFSAPDSLENISEKIDPLPFFAHASSHPEFADSLNELILSSLVPTHPESVVLQLIEIYHDRLNQTGWENLLEAAFINGKVDVLTRLLTLNPNISTTVYGDLFYRTKAEAALRQPCLDRILELRNELPKYWSDLLRMGLLNAIAAGKENPTVEGVVGALIAHERYPVEIQADACTSAETTRFIVKWSRSPEQLLAKISERMRTIAMDSMIETTP